MKKVLTFIAALLLVIAMAACTQSPATSLSMDQEDLTSSEVLGGAANGDAGEATIDTTTDATATKDVDPLAPNEDAADYNWDAGEIISIQLNGANATSETSGVQINGSTITIGAAGTYEFSGSLSDGQIVVNTEDAAIVRLILNGVSIHNEDGPAIDVENANKVLVYLPEGSQNQLSDGSNYMLSDPESDEPNATLFSKADLMIDGLGSLLVLASYNDGIASKDGLIVNNGVITVSSVDDGLRGRDYIVIHQGNLTISADGDGLKSDEQDDASKGYIQIDDGTLTVTAGMDAMDAETDLVIQAGSFNLTAGGGSTAATFEDVSMKGLKGLASVVISGGNFTINAADDAIHSNGDIMIYNGAFSIASGDDGIHSDSSLTIEAGQVTITESYEGLESAIITINGGAIALVASDDGINVAGGADGSGMSAQMGGGGRPGRNAGPGFDGFASAGNYYLYINGGTVFVNAGGDGIDSNGSVAITDGTVIVNGPTQNMNGALDYMGDFSISGGILIAAGSAGMAQAPTTNSTQATVLVNFNGTISGGTAVNVQNSAGETVFTFTPLKSIQSLVFSLPDLVTGETYTISVGGNAGGDSDSGLVLGGIYSDGSEYTTFTVSSIVTQIGGGGGNFRR